jgi:hypothetical protein
MQDTAYKNAVTNNLDAIKAADGGVCVFCGEQHTPDAYDEIIDVSTVVCPCGVDAVVPVGTVTADELDALRERWFGVA